jgi:hypothetical protein
VFTSTGYDHCFFCTGVFTSLLLLQHPSSQLSFSFMRMQHTAQSSFSLQCYALVDFFLVLYHDRSDTYMYRIYRMSAFSEMMPSDRHDLRCRQIIMILDADRPLWSPIPITWSIDERYPGLHHSICRLIVKLMIQTIPLRHSDHIEIDRHHPTTITIDGNNHCYLSRIYCHTNIHTTPAVSIFSIT